jgi:lipopolysaccharide/colanic/teichoic acid biosynthesis glycosyltransferase
VFKGNLSLVGPRPHAVHAKAENRLYDEAVDGYFARHRVKPGITGWAQVCRGYAADIEGAADKLSYDLYYLKHRALALDLAITAKTALVVLSGFGSR